MKYWEIEKTQKTVNSMKVYNDLKLNVGEHPDDI